MIVDSHCHASPRWYEPVDTLLFNMDRCGVDRAVLIQLLGTTDSSAMISAQREHPDRIAFIGAIDPDAPDARDAISRAADQGAVGLRMRASWRSKEGDPLGLWRQAEALGLRVSMVGTVASFLDGRLEQIADACPELVLLLEHAAGLGRPDAGDRAAALPQLCALAAYGNIAIKLPGLGQMAPRLPDPDTADMPLDMGEASGLLEALISAFGTHRCLWGSDFPPVAAREGYRNALEWTRAFVGARWPDGVADCFGAAAARLFSLD